MSAMNSEMQPNNDGDGFSFFKPQPMITEAIGTKQLFSMPSNHTGKIIDDVSRPIYIIVKVWDKNLSQELRSRI